MNVQHLICTVEGPPAGRAGYIRTERGDVSPVESPQSVSDVDGAGDVPGDLPLGPTLRVDRQRVGGHRVLGSRRPGADPQHHHVLADHVKRDNDCLTN